MISTRAEHRGQRAEDRSRGWPVSGDVAGLAAYTGNRLGESGRMLRETCCILA